MSEAISDMRIDYRWMAIDLENEEITLAKGVGRKHVPQVFKTEIPEDNC